MKWKLPPPKICNTGQFLEWLLYSPPPQCPGVQDTFKASPGRHLVHVEHAQVQHVTGALLQAVILVRRVQILAVTERFQVLKEPYACINTSPSTPIY